MAAMKLTDLNTSYTRWGTQEICVVGMVDVSDCAVARLKEIGINLPSRGKYYGTFYVPPHLAHEFWFVPGDKYNASELLLLTEV